MDKPVKMFFIAALGAAALANPASAAMVATPLKSNGEKFGYKFEFDAGQTKSKAGEHVYLENAPMTSSRKYSGKLSQLDWDSNVFMIGGSGSVRRKSLSLNIGLWTGLDTSDDDGNMKDQDWIPYMRYFYLFGYKYYYGNTKTMYNYTDSECDLASSAVLDMNVAYEFNVANSLTVFPLAGLHYERWEWDANGAVGYYQTANSPVFVSPDTTGISYEQEYFYPYIGLNAQYEYGKFLFSGYFTYAPGYSSKERDDHKLRHILHENDYSFGGSVVSLGLSAKYYINEGLYVGISYDMMRTSTQKTHGIRQSYESGALVTTEEKVDWCLDGMDISSSTISLKVGAEF